jgi:Amt family ammonium transporter
MGINAGDTAWLLASSALVLLMTPGLAFFYGGLTRAKSTLNMISPGRWPPSRPR